MDLQRPLTLPGYSWRIKRHEGERAEWTELTLIGFWLHMFEWFLIYHTHRDTPRMSLRPRLLRQCAFTKAKSPGSTRSGHRLPRHSRSTAPRSSHTKLFASSLQYLDSDLIWRPRDCDSTQGLRESLLKVPIPITNVRSIQQDFVAQNWGEEKQRRMDRYDYSHRRCDLRCQLRLTWKQLGLVGWGTVGDSGVS
jgi:hypothetical protein